MYRGLRFGVETDAQSRIEEGQVRQEYSKSAEYSQYIGLDAAHLAPLDWAGELTSVWVPDPNLEAMRDPFVLDRSHQISRPILVGG